MNHLVSQFRRMWNDDGRNDKIFAYQEHKLKNALIKLKDATDEVVKQSRLLQDLLTLKDKPAEDQIH